MRKLLFSVALVVLGAGVASADPYLFGFSGGTGAQQLILNGGTTVLDTSQSQFNLGSDNQGWWSPLDPNSGTTNDNYLVGPVVGLTVFGDHRNFFTFDLRGLDIPITSADLSLPRFSSSGPLPVTYRLWDVTTDTATLNNTVGTNPVIFADLGSGTSFGSVVVSDLLLPDPLVIHLNGDALSALVLAEGGFFSIGGSLEVEPAPVPEPATLLLLGGGLAGLAARRRRNQA